MKYLAHTARVLGAATLLLATHHALAADLLVSPNQNYFQGWSFNVSDKPRGCGAVNILLGTDTITGTLGTLTYRVEAMDEATRTMATNDTVWLDCRWNYFGAGIPSGNNPPSALDTSHVRAGNFRHTFSSPLPAGSLMLFQDFDGSEDTTITFRTCSGQAIDASGFDWLRVSDPNIASSAIIPTHTAGATWHITGTTGNSANETTGIVIRSGDVCQVETVNTKSGASSGGRHFFFGVLPTTSLTATVQSSGGPAGGFSGNFLVSLACTLNGQDVSNQLLPASPVSVSAGATPGAVTFNSVPIGAVCTATQTPPAPPVGYAWKPVSATNNPLTTVADPAANQVTFTNALVSANMQATINPPSSTGYVGAPITPIPATCTNAGPDTATQATCSVTGLPAGLSSTCAPTPPTTLAAGAAITCTITGTPTSTGTFPFSVTTGATENAILTDDTAQASLTVAGPLAGQPDSRIFTAGQDSTPIANVTANDTVLGQPVMLGAGGNATIGPLGTWPAGITLDTATGAVRVTADVPVGSYTLQYQLCNTAGACVDVEVTLTGRAAAAIAPVPTLHEWLLMVLLAGVAGLGARHLRARR